MAFSRAFRARVMAPHVENRISISLDLTYFQSNRKIFISYRKSNHNVSNQIFPSQVELPKWLKLRFKSQSRLPITATQSGLMMLKTDAINQSINQYTFNSIMSIEHGYSYNHTLARWCPLRTTTQVNEKVGNSIPAPSETPESIVT